VPRLKRIPLSRAVNASFHQGTRMDNTARNLPQNTSIIVPRLVCRDPALEVDFCVHAFEAVEVNKRQGPDGTLAHALLTIGPEMIMIEAEWPGLPSRAPTLDATSPVVIFVYVPDVDKVVERATGDGARVLVPLENQFWGDRIAWLMDPSGHVWTVATRIEQTTAEERTKRWDKIRTEQPEQGGAA
jgi:PhnB protein